VEPKVTAVDAGPWMDLSGACDRSGTANGVAAHTHPERWPAGDPQEYDQTGMLGLMHGGYHDIDGGPSIRFLVAGVERPEIRRFLEIAV
jgi:hypothetical protein